jgi:hypothetical protein
VSLHLAEGSSWSSFFVAAYCHSNYCGAWPVSLTDAVVKGENTIKDDEMPFVNRHEELWQIFRFNAEVQRKIIESKTDIKNFRLLTLLFCVQVRVA